MGFKVRYGRFTVVQGDTLPKREVPGSLRSSQVFCISLTDLLLWRNLTLDFT